MDPDSGIRRQYDNGITVWFRAADGGAEAAVYIGWIVLLVKNNMTKINTLSAVNKDSFTPFAQVIFSIYLIYYIEKQIVKTKIMVMLSTLLFYPNHDNHD